MGKGGSSAIWPAKRNPVHKLQKMLSGKAVGGPDRWSASDKEYTQAPNPRLSNDAPPKLSIPIDEPPETPETPTTPHCVMTQLSEPEPTPAAVVDAAAAAVAAVVARAPLEQRAASETVEPPEPLEPLEPLALETDEPLAHETVDSLASDISSNAIAEAIEAAAEQHSARQVEQIELTAREWTQAVLSRVLEQISIEGAAESAATAAASKPRRLWGLGSLFTAVVGAFSAADDDSVQETAEDDPFRWS